MYSYVIEVADSESNFGWFSTALDWEIFAFYNLLKYAQGRPGRREHVHLSQNFGTTKENPPLFRLKLV